MTGAASGAAAVARRARQLLRLCLLAIPAVLCGAAIGAQPAAVTTVTVSDDGSGPPLAPHFLGLSYEMSLIHPEAGHSYFDPSDTAVVNVFRTLGITSLRVGAAAVDKPLFTAPGADEIAALFSFARAAGVTVIYSVRLAHGDPADSARQAACIAAHDADALDCFSIGNEPNAYHHTFAEYFADWKRHYDAILAVVPQARFDGPSVYAADQNHFPQLLADALFPAGHLAMISDHYYVMGLGAAAAADVAGTQARFLSDAADVRFAHAFAAVGKPLMERGIPYRIDELNNCFHGGAKGISDTYTAALWALDATHWWAAHHILGLNYHTGEFIADGILTGQNYSAFVHLTPGGGLDIRGPSYGYLAFSQGAHGRPIQTAVATADPHHVTAYAFRADDRSIYVTVIDKAHGGRAEPLPVTVQLPTGVVAAGAQRMDLVQQDGDIGAHAGILLGGAPITDQGLWKGTWQPVPEASGQDVTVTMVPASATLLHCLPAP
jgi:hypothetical protein